ncbi:MAG: energy transducer TonB [Stenotrophomonas sp.]
MSMTHPEDLHDHLRDARVSVAPMRGLSLWLLLGLIAALIVAALGWWQHLGNTQRPVAGPASVTSAILSTPQTAFGAESAVARQPHTIVRAVLNRPVTPLAGNPPPAYPPDAVRAGLEGGVTARISVDARGNVHDVVIVDRHGSGDQQLDQAVINALSTWRFEPALREGRATASVVQVPVEFRTAR